MFGEEIPSILGYKAFEDDNLNVAQFMKIAFTYEEIIVGRGKYVAFSVFLWHLSKTMPLLIQYGRPSFENHVSYFVQNRRK